MGNIGHTNVIFQNAVTTTGTGTEFNVNGAEEMNIQFIMTSGTFTAQIKALGVDQSTWYAYPSFKLPTYELMSSTITDKSFLYNVDLRCISKIRVELTALSGTITVLGKAVS